MTGPAETASMLVVLAALAIGAMIVLPRPKPEPPPQDKPPVEVVVDGVSAAPAVVRAEPLDKQAVEQQQVEDAKALVERLKARVERIERKLDGKAK